MRPKKKTNKQRNNEQKRRKSFLESKRYENKKMVYQTVRKVCYTNVDGLMPTKMEINELLNWMLLYYVRQNRKMNGKLLTWVMINMIYGWKTEVTREEVE